MAKAFGSATSGCPAVPFIGGLAARPRSRRWLRTSCTFFFQPAILKPRRQRRCGVRCRHVLESLSAVYHNDAIAREQNLSPEERLLFHQAESGPMMEDLHLWLARQFDEHLVEPNSALGGAIAYLLRHWEKLTLFLRVAGAPLDNNVCERAIKKAILHRKNAYFYKTCHGAHVGDVFMSLIYSCELCGGNPFDYLTELDRHADRAGVAPQDWMPWNYQETLERTAYAETSSPESRPEDGCCGKAPQGAGETHEM
jgi:transposase